MPKIFDISHTVLLEIDLQNDFCPGGALAVDSGDQAIPPLNKLAAAINAAGGRVALSQDWHPPGHISFTTWPEHCVQGTWGAQFHDKLDTRPISMIIRKGFRPNLDSYSAFFENDRKTPTGLEGWLRTLETNNIIIGGLATDYCVYYSVMDALKLNLQVIVVSDAIFGVDIPKGSIDKAINAMKNNGALFMSSDEIKEIIS